eukprot:gene11245-12544_t
MGNQLHNLVAQHVLNALDPISSEIDGELIELVPSESITLPNRHRDRGYALTEVTQLSDNMFSTMFRMDREAFNNLLGLVSPFLPDTDEHMAIVSSGSYITKATKLYATLRYLAGGSYIDICFAWGISKASFFSTDPYRGVLWPTMEALDQTFTIGLPVHDVRALERMASEFEILSHGELPGCVTAIDG